MAKAQGKKAAGAGSKSAAKKVAARVKSAAAAAKKKVLPKKAAPAKPAPKKAAPQKAKPAAKPAKPAKPASKAAAKKPAPKKAAKPAAKPVQKAKAAAKTAVKAVKTATKKVVAKVAAAAPKAKAAAPSAKPAAKPAPAKAAAPAKPAAKAPAKPAAKPAAPAAKPAKPELKAKAVKPAPPTPAPVAPNVPAAPKPPVVEEKKRGRRARPRVVSNGAPAASWLSSEKPRPASFIAAPARAEAPSAVAAPPASSDRLIREEDLAHPAVRIVPIRIDVEQGAGRFYVIANPMEVSVRVTEGLEWDFRYIGGADVNVEEIVIEFDKPSPFTQNVFRTRKPGGARPHRQLSGGALPAAAGKRVSYTVRAINQFKTELANTRVFLTITA